MAKTIDMTSYLLGKGKGGGTPAVLEEKSVEITSQDQVIEPSEGYDGMSSVTVTGVSSSVDSNIVASNIKSGVSILGVSGNISMPITSSPNLGTLSTLTVTSNPDKTIYNDLEYFDFTGLVITATYSNGQSYDVTNQCTYLMNQPLEAGDSITAYYLNKSVSVPVTVNFISVPAPSTTTILAHFNGNKINEVTGTDIASISSYSAYNDGKFGIAKVVNTSGNSNIFNIPVNRTNGLTIEFWGKHSITSNAPNGRFWGSSYPLFVTNNNITQTGYQFNYVGTGQMFSSQTVVTIPTAFDTSKFHHYAFVMDTNNNFRFYFDGVLMTEGIMGTAPTTFNWYSIELSTAMDELLICNSAKYTTNFEPSRGPYYLEGGE